MPQRFTNAFNATSSEVRHPDLEGPHRSAGRRGAQGGVVAGGAALIAVLGLLACDKSDGANSSPPGGDGASATSSASLALPMAAGNTVLFTVRGNVGAPLLCFDGTAAAPGDSDEVCATAMQGANTAATDSGASVELGPQEPSACGASSDATSMVYPLRMASGDESKLAIAPASQAASMKVAKDWIEPTEAEKAALTKLAKDGMERPADAPFKLDWFSGVTADLDADGKLDRVFGAHEESLLIGVVAVFFGSDPATPHSLSLMSFDFPRVVAVTNVDGQPGDEIVIEAAFVEGIERETVTSAFSTRVVAWTSGAAQEVGSWGCRMF